MGLCRPGFPGLEVAILRALLPMGAKFSSMTGGPRWEEEFLLVAGALAVLFITGSTDGVGKQAAVASARLSAHVLVHGCNRDKDEGVLDETRHLGENTRVDLGRLSS